MEIYKSIREIRLQKSLNQQIIADALNVDVAVVSNIEKGKRDLKVRELEKISNVLGVSVIDLITYPKKYVEKTPDDDSVDAVLQIRLDKEMKERVLKIVLGERVLDILHK